MSIVVLTALGVGGATMLGAVLGFLIKKFRTNLMIQFWVLRPVLCCQQQFLV